MSRKRNASLATGRRRWLVAGSVALAALSATIVGVVLTDRAASAPIPLIPPDPQRLVIQRPQRVDIVLARDGTDDDWRIQAPCSLAVDQRRLSPLFEALSGGGTHYPAGEVDLSGAGLQPPLATLQLDGQALSIGGTDLSGSRRYVASDARVHLVPEWLWPLVNGGLSALAEPAVFEAPIAAVQRAADAPVGVPDDATDDTDSATGSLDTQLDTQLDAQLDARLDAARWNALEAAQIVAWPLTEPVPVRQRERLKVTFEGGESTTVELLVTDRFEALVREPGGCAHLLDTGTLRPDGASSPAPDNP